MDLEVSFRSTHGQAKCCPKEKLTMCWERVLIRLMLPSKGLAVTTLGRIQSSYGRGKILKLLWIAWFIHYDLLSARAVLNLLRYAWSERISIWFICECPCGFKVNRSFYRIGSLEGFDETTRSMWHRLVSFSSVSYLLYLSCSIVWHWLSRQEKFGNI